jgi:hypothetical protein
MKAALCIALLALLAVSAVVDANLFVPLRKKGPKPMTAAQASLVANGYPVPLKGNIPQYGEYVNDDGWYIIWPLQPFSLFSANSEEKM